VLASLALVCLAFGCFASAAMRLDQSETPAALRVSGEPSLFYAAKDRSFEGYRLSWQGNDGRVLALRLVRRTDGSAWLQSTQIEAPKPATAAARAIPERQLDSTVQPRGVVTPAAETFAAIGQALPQVQAPQIQAPPQIQARLRVTKVISAQQFLTFRAYLRVADFWGQAMADLDSTVANGAAPRNVWTMEGAQSGNFRWLSRVAPRDQYFLEAARYLLRLAGIDPASMITQDKQTNWLRG
jgi:hypothetical protein